MSVTLEQNGTTVATGPAHYFTFVDASTVMVVNFSDGTRIAITDFNDEEAQDPAYGIEAASGGTEVANLWMWGMNAFGSGATFKVHDYTSGSLGTLIYTYLNTTDSDATIQFRYNTATNTLSIYTSTTGHMPDTDGTISGFSGTLATSSAVCFLRGTRILTDRGEVAVETLATGDRVATRFGGLRPIRWIGHQRFDGRFAGPDQQPIRIHAGALGEGLPHTDLFVSPGHAMLVGLGGGEDVLAHAAALVNDITITRAQVAGEIAYFHLDLGPHDCVLANGTWAETYFEDHNRDSFHNAAHFRALHPDHVAHRQGTCLPVITAAHARAGAVHAHLAPRLADAELTHDAGIHLLADGRRIPAESLDGNRWAATIPAGTRSLRLCSRFVRPSMVSDSSDHRALGLMVRGLAIDGTRIAADHPALSRGWHAAEHDAAGTWRWTDGDATLPARLLGDGGATLLPIRVVIDAWHAPRLFAAEAATTLRDAA